MCDVPGKGKHNQLNVLDSNVDLRCILHLSKDSDGLNKVGNLKDNWQTSVPIFRTHLLQIEQWCVLSGLGACLEEPYQIKNLNHRDPYENTHPAFPTPLTRGRGVVVRNECLSQPHLILSFRPFHMWCGIRITGISNETYKEWRKYHE